MTADLREVPDVTTMATPFWRTEPITPEEEELWSEVIFAHGASAMRNNVSSVVLMNCATGSSNYVQSIAGALMTLGGTHAPIEQTMFMLMTPNPIASAAQRLDEGLLVPGWGNSFEKEKKDGQWLAVDEIIQEHFPSHYAILEGITELLHDRGKNIFPNPSAYSAIAAMILKLPVALSPYLFVSGRIGAWSLLFGQMLGVLKPHKPSERS